MVDQRDLFSSSEDELLVEIGRELESAKGGSKRCRVRLRRGERFVQERIEDCGNR